MTTRPPDSLDSSDGSSFVSTPNTSRRGRTVCFIVCGVFHRDSGTIGGEEMLLVKSPLISLSLRDL